MEQHLTMDIASVIIFSEYGPDPLKNSGPKN